jgi:hypothetical protein
MLWSIDCLDKPNSVARRQATRKVFVNAGAAE